MGPVLVLCVAAFAIAAGFHVLAILGVLQVVSGASAVVLMGSVFAGFGAAILISVIDGVVQGAAQSSGDGNSVLYSPSTSSDVMTEVLKSTVNIRPTVTKRNGDRIQILVARDLDFRSVYELKPTARAR